MNSETASLSALPSVQTLEASAGWRSQPQIAALPRASPIGSRRGGMPARLNRFDACAPTQQSAL
jgi:hypothetical protein